MEAFLQAHGGAAVLNPAYPRCWELLESFRQAPKTGLRVSLWGWETWEVRCSPAWSFGPGD